MEIVLGKKGTGFISDANGLHAGSVPKIATKNDILGKVWFRPKLYVGTSQSSILGI